jgi:hypothetical protein
VEAIRTWWKRLGRRRHPQAAFANHGRQWWQQQLPQSALESRTATLEQRDGPGNPSVSFPARHQQVEQDRASAILSCDAQWRGQFLETYEIVVNLIGSTTTDSGLTVRPQIDAEKYEKGRKVSDEDFAAVNISPSRFHGEWNYVIRPND